MIDPLPNLDHLSASGVNCTSKLLQMQNPALAITDEPLFMRWIGAWCDQFSWYWRAPRAEEIQ